MNKIFQKIANAIQAYHEVDAVMDDLCILLNPYDMAEACSDSGHMMDLNTSTSMASGAKAHLFGHELHVTLLARQGVPLVVDKALIPPPVNYRVVTFEDEQPKTMALWPKQDTYVLADSVKNVKKDGPLKTFDLSPY